MNMKDLLEYNAQKKKENAKKWNLQKQEDGECKGLTQQEYNSMKVGKVKRTTRRVHSKGNLWNHQNVNTRVKTEIVINNTLVKY